MLEIRHVQKGLSLKLIWSMSV
ncbi:hypothetical protein LINPERHAP1_LOCUS1588 [Linum perenne]